MKNETDNSLEVKGTVKNFLMNPKGDVDGFLFDDGTQVNFPPHMSSQLTAVIAPKDKVEVKGIRENDKVIKAKTVINIQTSKSVLETPPTTGPKDEGKNLSPPPPHQKPEHAPKHLEGLKQLSVHGEIQSQIFGHRGEVIGVVLTDGSIVRFGPRMLDDSKVKTDIGQSLQASGPGTKNSYGQALEATELSNK